MGESMSKHKKRLIKKITIVAVPIVLCSAISYAAIVSQTQAHESAYAFEHYYDNDEYTDSNDEYNNLNSDEVDPEEDKVITSNDFVELDTKPDSTTVLVNKELTLPKDYIPKDLVVPNVQFTISYFDEKKQMRKSAAKALERLFAAASEDSYTLYGVSAYRSYQRQYEIFTSNIRKQGLEHTLQYSAKPGSSEHQTGLSIDVSAKSVNNRLDSSFGETAEGRWLAENAHLFGFIIRYPEEKADITGYSYEPWHIRYVGKALATYLYNNNLCLEEYYHFEPSSDEISYESLADYGIDLDDITDKPASPVPTRVPKDTQDEMTTEDETTGDENTIGETIDNSADETIDNSTEEDSGNTKDNGKPGSEKPVPSKIPTPTPTVTPVPTKKPTPTPIPTVVPEPTQVPDSVDIPETTDTEITGN